jgi:hypothetical protein
MVELSSMDVTMAARLELALQPGTGSVIVPGTVSAGAVVGRGGVGLRDVGPQPV